MFYISNVLRQYDAEWWAHRDPLLCPSNDETLLLSSNSLSKTTIRRTRTDVKNIAQVICDETKWSLSMQLEHVVLAYGFEIFDAVMLELGSCNYLPLATVFENVDTEDMVRLVTLVAIIGLREAEDDNTPTSSVATALSVVSLINYYDRLNRSSSGLSHSLRIQIIMEGVLRAAPQDWRVVFFSLLTFEQPEEAQKLAFTALRNVWLHSNGKPAVEEEHGKMGKRGKPDERIGADEAEKFTWWFTIACVRESKLQTNIEGHEIIQSRLKRAAKRFLSKWRYLMVISYTAMKVRRPV